MAVIKRGILGGFSGSVGNVVGSSWKGIATMKAKPLSVSNPNTAGQIAERTKMQNVVIFAKEILTSIIKPLNDRFASGMSGYNLFVQRNISLFAVEIPTPQADLILSSGNVAPAVNFAVSGDVSDAELIFTWDDNSGVGNALATDEIYVVVVCDQQSGIAFEGALAARNASPANIELPAAWVAGNTIHAYASFRRADGTQVSDTAYAAGNVVA